MPLSVRGRQALRQEQVEQIAAALGLPPHKLTDELLEKPSVLALIGARHTYTSSIDALESDCISTLTNHMVLFFLADSSAGNPAQIAEARSSSSHDPSRVAARAKVAATAVMAATTKTKGSSAQGEDDRRRPARGRGRRAARR